MVDDRHLSIEDLAERITALESRIAYQDRLLDSLDVVVREFTARVETLEHEIRMLRGALGDTMDTGPGNEPPPHY